MRPRLLLPMFCALALAAAEAPTKQPLWEGVAPGLKPDEAPLPTKASYTVHLA